MAAILSVSVRLIAKTVNRNISEFLSKGRLCLSAYDLPKTRNCTNQRNHNLKKTFPFLVGGRGPNAVASTAPTLIRHWTCFFDKWEQRTESKYDEGVIVTNKLEPSVVRRTDDENIIVVSSLDAFTINHRSQFQQATRDLRSNDRLCNSVHTTTHTIFYLAIAGLLGDRTSRCI